MILDTRCAILSCPVMLIIKHKLVRYRIKERYQAGARPLCCTRWLKYAAVLDVRMLGDLLSNIGDQEPEADGLR